MKSFYSLGEICRRRRAARRGGCAGLTAVLIAFCIGMLGTAQAQVEKSADKGGLTIAAGATGSGYALQYGERKMLGVSAFVDVNSRRNLGLEAEARWLQFHQTADVHATTWLAGPRYHLVMGRFQPYAKTLFGAGQFNFPYNFAHGSYLVIAPGGGVDFRINHQISIRAVDFEYQIWPQFTYGSMSSYGVSTGVKIRVF